MGICSWLVREGRGWRCWVKMLYYHNTTISTPSPSPNPTTNNTHNNSLPYKTCTQTGSLTQTYNPTNYRYPYRVSMILLLYVKDLSVCLSVCPSVCLSVRPSVCLTKTFASIFSRLAEQNGQKFFGRHLCNGFNVCKEQDH